MKTDWISFLAQIRPIAPPNSGPSGNQYFSMSGGQVDLVVVLSTLLALLALLMFDLILTGLLFQLIKFFSKGIYNFQSAFAIMFILLIVGSIYSLCTFNTIPTVAFLISFPKVQPWTCIGLALVEIPFSLFLMGKFVKKMNEFHKRNKQS